MNGFAGGRKQRQNFDTMHRALKDSLKKPYIGVTQGGSSRKDSGCRVAATTAETKPYKPIGAKR